MTLCALPSPRRSPYPLRPEGRAAQTSDALLVQGSEGPTR
jgi:hypothetical protein